MSTIDKISVDGTVYDVAPGAGTVGTDALADGSVTLDKVADDLGEYVEGKCAEWANIVLDTKATAYGYGLVKIGDGIDVTNGVISITSGGSTYTLPAATADTLGGIKVGDGLSVTEDGTLSATGGSSGGGELADGSVTTAKLADSAVTSAKLANFCINRDSLFNQGVVTYSSLHDTVWAAIYPVGSVYCTANASFDPNSYSFSWSSGGTTLTLGRKQKTSGTWELLDNDGTVYRWKRVK